MSEFADVVAEATRGVALSIVILEVDGMVDAVTAEYMSSLLPAPPMKIHNQLMRHSTPFDRWEGERGPHNTPICFQGKGSCSHQDQP